MGAEIFSFPTRREPALRSSSGAVARQRRYSFAQLVRLLALEALATRTQVDRLRKLHDQRGLPAPINPRVFDLQVQTGSAAIGRKSVWCALEIDAWLDVRGTPPSAAANPVPALPSVRADCAARARMAGAA